MNGSICGNYIGRCRARNDKETVKMKGTSHEKDNFYAD